MDASTRRTRFEERVRIERDFLVPVNRCFGLDAPLAGMTAVAIDSWQRRASEVGGNIDIHRAADLLREAAARAELLADNSRDVFEADCREGPDGLAVIQLMLEKVLRA